MWYISHSLSQRSQQHSLLGVWNVFVLQILRWNPRTAMRHHMPKLIVAHSSLVPILFLTLHPWYRTHSISLSFADLWSRCFTVATMLGRRRCSRRSSIRKLLLACRETSLDGVYLETPSVFLLRMSPWLSVWPQYFSRLGVPNKGPIPYVRTGVTFAMNSVIAVARDSRCKFLMSCIALLQLLGLLCAQ
jgi:hypothetical protein